MRNLIEYVRKNAVFVGLLSIFVVFCGFFGGYVFTQRTNTVSDPPSPAPVVPVNDPEITTFEGSYGHDAAVHLSWSIDRADQELESVKLYYGDHALGGEMKDLTSFTMAQSVYQFPTGDCTFTLKAKLSEAGEISKDVTVFINYVVNIDMQTEQTADGMLLKLTYSYDKENPVSVPRIKFINSGNHPYELSYQETQREQSGNMEKAVTIFKLGTEQLEAGTYHLTVRWIFDGLNISKDYDVEIIK